MPPEKSEGDIVLSTGGSLDVDGFAGVQLIAETGSVSHTAQTTFSHTTTTDDYYAKADVRRWLGFNIILAMATLITCAVVLCSQAAPSPSVALTWCSQQQPRPTVSFCLCFSSVKAN